jgi:hypothetical protein
MVCSTCLRQAKGNHGRYRVTFLAYAALALATSVVSVASPSVKDGVELAQITIQRTTIVRVPALTPFVPPRQLKWKEQKGPKCLPMSALAGAAIIAPDAVDLMMRGGARIRAKLEKSCSSMDFYSGFYVKPSSDGQMCQSRDTIHSRAGGECGIDKFKLLVPQR